MPFARGRRMHGEGDALAKKRGRPAKAGERYDCGKLKPDGVSPTLAYRIREQAGKIAIDRRLGSELGRLLLLEQITTGEAACGWRVHDVWLKFESAVGLARGVRGAAFDVAVNRASALLVGDRDEEARIARDRWLALDKFLLKNFTGPDGRIARDRLETLCVDDRSIPYAWIEPVRAMLRLLALEHFGIKRPPRSEPGRLTASAPVRRALWRSEYGADVAKLVSAANPDLPMERISEIRDFHNALAERAKFDAEKKRERSKASAFG
jgi:hypothetical protein